MSRLVSEENARENVEKMANRCAMIYRHFAETIIEEFGEEKGKDLILKAINRYGEESGERMKKSPGGSDLPEYGWDTEMVSQTEDKDVIDITKCPLAEYWLANMDLELARLYCYVDQAKYKSYNPNYQCTHAKNVLDGDEKCRLVINKTRN